jgi:parvulin-like peptidyl-prolyl isomerase
MVRLSAVLAVTALCALCGCSDEDVVARCGDYEVTVDELRFEITQLGPSYKFDGSYEMRVKLVENLCARYILTEEASTLGLDEEAAQVEIDAERAAVGESYNMWRIEKAVRVPRISSLKWREKLDRSLHIVDIVFRSRGLAEEAMVGVRRGATLDILRAGFEGRDDVMFNDIGWKVWRDIDRSLTKYVFPLEVGQFSGIVNLPDGYHIFYMVDAKELGVKDEVLFLRARKFDRWIKEEKARRGSERELVARYNFRPNPDGIVTAMEAFSLAFEGERAPGELLEQPVAMFTGGQVTVADLFTFYFNSPPESRFYAGDGYSLMRASWELALPEIYTQAGYDMRLNELFEVRWVVAKARQDYLVPQMEDHLRSQIDVTDPDLEEYYAERSEDLATPVTYWASRILLQNEIEVNRVMAELNAGGDFAQIAEKYSHDTYTGAKGGDMGPVNYGIVAAYDSVVARMEPGDISEPFETNSGIEILMLRDRAGGEHLSFEEAIPYMEMFIRNQTANDMLAEVVVDKKEELGFFINEDLLANVWLPDPGWKQSTGEKSVVVPAETTD